MLIFFDCKGDFNSHLFDDPRLNIIRIQAQDLKLCPLDPMGMNTKDFAGLLTQLLASHLQLFASRRLLYESLLNLYQRKRPKGTWPSWSEWISEIESFPTKGKGRRLIEYIEASSFAIKGIGANLGRSINYSTSDFVYKALSYQGGVILQIDSLTDEAQSVVCGLFLNAAYELLGSQKISAPVTAILDDALPIVRKNYSSVGSLVHPIGRWITRGRSRGLGIIVSTQSYSELNEIITGNCSSILVKASFGLDQHLIMRDCHLTREQAELVPQLAPHEVIGVIRSVYPKAVFGEVPFVP